jgi:hypothetical protein
VAGASGSAVLASVKLQLCGVRADGRSVSAAVDLQDPTEAELQAAVVHLKGALAG